MLNMELVHYTRILLLASAAAESPRGPRSAGPGSATGLEAAPGLEPRCTGMGAPGPHQET